jgi:hypothetical protein
MKTLRERVEAKYVQEPNSGCWLWTGAMQRNGYGYFTLDRKNWRAHRLLYTMNVGPIPEGLRLTTSVILPHA